MADRPARGDPSLRLPRVRIALWGLMIAVAALAVLVNHFKPVTETDAIRIAIA
jgi:hypothetical protein